MAHKSYKCKNCGAEFDEIPYERRNECIASYIHRIYRCNNLGVIASNARELKRPIERLGEVWGRAGWDKWVYPERPLSATGWHPSKAKNKFLLYKSSLGRIRLFDTGTVELYVWKPASLGRCMQLFSDAFTKPYLITDIRAVDMFKGTLMRRFHATYKTGQRLQYMKVTTFEDTHKLIFVAGDRTHPDCYEFILEYHAEVEQARRLFDELRQSFGLNQDKPNGVPLKDDYSR